jgi:hypothetical protein
VFRDDEVKLVYLGAAITPGNGATRTVTYSDGKYVRVRFDHTSGSTGTMDVDVTKSGVVADRSQLGESGEAFGWYTATTLLSDLTSSATWTNAIPAGAKDVELVGRITTAITGPTSIEIGDGTDQDMFGAISTSNSWNTNTKLGPNCSVWVALVICEEHSCYSRWRSLHGGSYSFDHSVPTYDCSNKLIFGIESTDDTIRYRTVRSRKV